MATTKILLTKEEIEARLAAISGESNTSIAALENAVQTAQDRADDAYLLAQGRSRAIYYATNEEANAGLRALGSGVLKVGDNIYIGAVGVPDWYVVEVLTRPGTSSLPTSGTSFDDVYVIGYYKIAQLETEKVVLTDYGRRDIVAKYGSFSYDHENKRIAYSNDVGATTYISLADLWNKVPTTASVSTSGITVKNSSGSTLFTISGLTSAITNANATTYGKVKLYNSSSTLTWTGSSATNDGAVTPAAIGSYVSSTYATLSTVNSLNTTVSGHTNSINAHETEITALQNDQITVTIGDGLTTGGEITLTIPD